jgi:hypothetical protein
MSMSCTTDQLCAATSAARQTPDTPDVQKTFVDIGRAEMTIAVADRTATAAPYFASLPRSARPVAHTVLSAAGAELARIWRTLKKDLCDPYRPELHYMRGPGPKWREKHANASLPRNALGLSPNPRSRRRGCIPFSDLISQITSITTAYPGPIKMSNLTSSIILAGLLFFPVVAPAAETEPIAALCARRDLQAVREAQEEMTVRDTAAATGIKESTLRPLLKRLAKEGGMCGR